MVKLNLFPAEEPELTPWQKFMNTWKPEAVIQNACKYWCDIHRADLFFCAIPNEHSGTSGSYLNAMGRRAGIPDTFVIGATDGRLVFFEFKAPKKDLSKTQKIMIPKLENEFSQTVYVVDSKRLFQHYIVQEWGN